PAIACFVLPERRALGVELEPVTLKFAGNMGNVGNRRPRAAVFRHFWRCLVCCPSAASLGNMGNRSRIAWACCPCCPRAIRMGNSCITLENGRFLRRGRVCCPCCPCCPRFRCEGRKPVTHRRFPRWMKTRDSSALACPCRGGGVGFAACRHPRRVSTSRPPLAAPPKRRHPS